jgi:hypothetical protein
MATDGEQVLVLTKWGVKWLKFAWDLTVNGTPRDRVAKRLLGALDAVSEEATSFVDEHCYSSTHTITNSESGTKVVTEVVRKKKTIRKGKRSCFAAAIAQLAYNKFGERPMSEANVLVTRKWLQKLLAEDTYSDLRTCDKNVAIDRALFLSFVPTNAFRQMKLAIASNVWKDRCDEQTVFGKVFRLVSPARAVMPECELIA